MALQIRSELSEEISSGKLRPGEVLDERSLAARFGVSRTPVREALQQLAAIGLVRIEARNGVFVARFSIAELRSLFELLGELEAICAKLASRRLNEESAGLLREAMGACEAACKKGDMEKYREANFAFHEAIYKCARNDVLADYVLSIRQRTRRYRIGDLNTQGQIEKSLADHREILAAILKGDEDAAFEAMVRHVPIGHAGFSEFLSSLPPHFFEG